MVEFIILMGVIIIFNTVFLGDFTLISFLAAIMLSFVVAYYLFIYGIKLLIDLIKMMKIYWENWGN